MLSTEEIMKRIPQRPPMLMVDVVTELEEVRIAGYKNVSAAEIQFRGHFPDHPILPGVLTLEALFQLSWLLYVNNPEAVKRLGVQAKSLNITQIERLKYRRPVRPGERLDLEIQEVSWDEASCQVKLKAKASVAEQKALEGVIYAQLVS